MIAVAPGGGRRLNHVEFAFRPGEQPLATAFFEALGCSCETIDTPEYGAYVVVSLDGSPHGENDMFASQAEPEQLALEEALRREITVAGSPMAQAASEFRALQRDKAFRATHIGLRIPDIAAFDGVLGRLRALAQTTHAGRLELGFSMERSLEDARASDTPVKQIWVWTDVVSTGLLAFGQQIELQTYEP